jgi:ATP-binding cassette, subfamily B, bacterial
LGFVVWQSFNVYYFIKRAGKIEMNFAYDVRQKAFTKLQELSFNYYDKTPLGWIMARMTSDITRLSEILSWGLMDMVWGFSVMIGITIVMLITNWETGHAYLDGHSGSVVYQRIFSDTDFKDLS